ncbi:hypothetical protein BDV25DRAFT_170330 [Aspergillus avenaceus]|uniref:Short chain dehydrogenase/reductase n=1 Tax=Aspergillus avenaceus TaxID=36643 RepID=A0A5N6U8T3_ASPAV|nr:hypothetical protein BDV25DRAFT_170330 [Aspergillus avenaceus]
MPTILITGANSGIGYATALKLSTQPNNHTILACRSPQKAQETLLSLTKTSKGTLSTLPLDVDDDASISAAVNIVSSQFGKLDILINNAGITAHTATGRERLQRTFCTNVFGSMLVAEAFTPLLLRSECARLIQVSSALGSMGLASDEDSMYYGSCWSEYRMSKAAVNMMVLELGKRLEGRVRVFAFCPGLVRSRLRGEGEEHVSAGGLAGDPGDSARGILDIVLGKRDGEESCFLHGEGVYPW